MTDLPYKNQLRSRQSPQRNSEGASNEQRRPDYQDSADNELYPDIKGHNGQATMIASDQYKIATGVGVARDVSIINEAKGGVTVDADTFSLTKKSAAEINDHEVKESGASFEELVDRLLSQPISKSDAKFSAIFLCLYRNFAAPSSLIMAIVRRFEALNDQDIPFLTRMTSQLRFLNVLRDWVANYPGDFAHPLTRRIMASFVQGLAASQEYAVASKEICPHLDIVSEDDDTQWACSDKSRSRANTTESILTISSAQSAASTLNADSPTLTADSSTEDIVDQIQSDKSSPRISGTPSSIPSINQCKSQSSGSCQTFLNTVEKAQRQAQLLTPIPKNLLSRVHWHQLMDVPDNEVARELTRIDWIMYCSIRPRDLIRHVSLPSDQKEKCKGLEHVSRMIHQFNRVAFWVANMILLRDKPKHRARALEKFMSIAWKLRHLNNYNSLGAVIAGINSTAIHRLAQTRELIPASAQKQFMRLEILMGTQKSHFAYRLAWANTSTQRIPFLPLHRRDLVLAEQANRTYVAGEEGERINWKKFEIMGEVIIGIQKSQEVTYPTMNRNEVVQRLVIDGRFCEDDDVSTHRIPPVLSGIFVSQSPSLESDGIFLATLRTQHTVGRARCWRQLQKDFQLVSAVRMVTTKGKSWAWRCHGGTWEGRR